MSRQPAAARRAWQIRNASPGSGFSRSLLPGPSPSNVHSAFRDSTAKREPQTQTCEHLKQHLPPKRLQGRSCVTAEMQTSKTLPGSQRPSCRSAAAVTCQAQGAGAASHVQPPSLAATGSEELGIWGKDPKRVTQPTARRALGHNPNPKPSQMWRHQRCSRGMRQGGSSPSTSSTGLGSLHYGR